MRGMLRVVRFFRLLASTRSGAFIVIDHSYNRGQVPSETPHAKHFSLLVRHARNSLLYDLSRNAVIPLVFILRKIHHLCPPSDSFYASVDQVLGVENLIPRQRRVLTYAKFFKRTTVSGLSINLVIGVAV